jgi:4,5-DOPA dioxygenase extradiol
MARSPVLFIGHGSPMNTLETNGFTESWRNFGQSVAKPRAVLVVSAHWYFGATAVTAMARPRTIHDFYGFPQALFDFQYPAPGAPDLAREVADIAKPQWVGLDRDQWGIDHGAWSVLAHLYPEADVPVVQLSLNALKPWAYHLDLAARLAPLRDQGVMILASGNVVHNLQRLRWDQPDLAFDWAERFDDAVVDQLASDPAAIARVAEHADFEMAVPTPDHFLPLLYVAALAGAAGESPAALVRGYSMGSISMTCYGLGMEASGCRDRAGAASLPPGPPPDQTNI